MILATSSASLTTCQNAGGILQPNSDSFGYRNAWVQITRGDVVDVVPLKDGSYTLPSVVTFLEGGDCLVGHAAKK